MSSSHVDTIQQVLQSAMVGPWGRENALRSLLKLEDENQRLREALKAVFEVACVSTEGDPWYVENEGIDATAAYELARAALGGTPSEDTG